MAVDVPTGDLARVVTHEANSEWPFLLEIVAYYGDSRKGKRKSITISRDEFFGKNGHGAPMTADALWAMINKLRRQPERKDND